MLTELENYLLRIEDLHRQIIDLIASLPEAALNWRPISGGDGDDTNSLAVLVTHIAGAEHFWVGEAIGGRPPTRNRDLEFLTQANNADTLIEKIQAVEAETRSVLVSLKAEDLSSTRLVRGKTVAVRWALLHVIDHTALHVGHMQLTYQLWNKGHSKAAPLWYERLPKKSEE